MPADLPDAAVLAELSEIERELKAQDIAPDWWRNVPRCRDGCPSFDGKRCEKLGHRPDGLCEPAVSELVRGFARLRIELREAREQERERAADIVSVAPIDPEMKRRMVHAIRNGGGQ